PRSRPQKNKIRIATKKTIARFGRFNKRCPAPGMIQASRQITVRFQRLVAACGEATSAFRMVSFMIWRAIRQGRKYVVRQSNNCSEVLTASQEMFAQNRTRRTSDYPLLCVVCG